MPTDHLFLKIDLGSIPMLQRNSDPPRDEITSAAHPERALVAHPDDLVETARSVGRCDAGARIDCAILEAHQVSRRFAERRTRQEPALRPAHLDDAITEPLQFSHRMKRDERVIGAGLHRQIAARARGHELIAVEFGQIDQRLGPLGGQPVAVRAVLDEKPGPEAERERQPSRRQAQRGGAVRRFHGQVLAERTRRLPRCHARRRVGPSAQHRRHLVAGLRDEVECDEVAVHRLRRRDAGLMPAKERLV